MAAPTLAASGAYQQASTGSTRTPAIPSGVAAGSLVVIALGVASAVSPSAATDFTKRAEVGASNPNSVLQTKVASGSESGTYSVPTGTSLSTSAAIVLRIEGGDDSNQVSASNAASSSSSTTTAAVSLTAAAESLLVWMCTQQSDQTVTVPSGFTRVTPSASQRMHVAVKEHSGGATGSITGTLGGALINSAALIAIPKAPVGSDAREWNGSTEALLTAREWNGSTEIQLSASEWNGSTEVALS